MRHNFKLLDDFSDEKYGAYLTWLQSNRSSQFFGTDLREVLEEGISSARFIRLYGCPDPLLSPMMSDNFWLPTSTTNGGLACLQISYMFLYWLIGSFFYIFLKDIQVQKGFCDIVKKFCIVFFPLKGSKNLKHFQN